MSSNYLAEQSVIGGILINPERIHDIADLVSSGDFEGPQHALAYKAFESLVSDSKPIDIFTVIDEIKKSGATADFTYLAELNKNVPSSANIDQAAIAVKDASTERDLLSMSCDMVSIIHGDGKTTEKVEEINKLMSTIGHETGHGIREAKSIMRGLVEMWQKRSEVDGSLMGYSTGFTDLDRRTMGLQAPDLTIIAAKSGAGKTTLAMNMVQAVAINQGKPVLVFSLEMSGEQLMDRMVAAVGKIPMNLIKSGKAFDSDYSHCIAPAVDKINRSMLHIDDRGGLTIGQIQATARKFFRKHGQGLLVVDYIGLVSAKGNNKQEQTAIVSGGLKSIAKELNIPVLALAQVNRNSVQRGEKRPMASDLRDSAAIEHDADCLIMLYEDEDNNPGTIEAHFVKFRNGEVGTDYLTKRFDINRFEDQEKGYRPPELKSVGGGMNY